MGARSHVLEPSGSRCRMRTRRLGFGRPDGTFEPRKSCGLSPQLPTSELARTLRPFLHVARAFPANWVKPPLPRLALEASITWWRMTGSNRRPPACKAGALPTELIPQGPEATLTNSSTDLTLRCGPGGLEPPMSPSRQRHFCFWHNWLRWAGFEPATSWL